MGGMRKQSDAGARIVAVAKARKKCGASRVDERQRIRLGSFGLELGTGEICESRVTRAAQQSQPARASQPVWRLETLTSLLASHTAIEGEMVLLCCRCDWRDISCFSCQDIDITSSRQAYAAAGRWRGVACPLAWCGDGRRRAEASTCRLVRLGLSPL